MFISPKQAGQIAATLGVGILAGGLTKLAGTKLYQKYYQYQYEPKKDNQQAQAAFKAAKQIASYVLNFASPIIGFTAGAYFANYMGWFSLASLASRASVLENLSSEETSKKVNDFVEKTPIVDQKIETPEKELFDAPISDAHRSTANEDQLSSDGLYGYFNYDHDDS